MTLRIPSKKKRPWQGGKPAPQSNRKIEQAYAASQNRGKEGRK